jgi:ribosomal protein S18 acetylase RimI-like enzyme
MGLASHVRDRSPGEGVELRLGRLEDRDFVIELAVETFAPLGDYRATMQSWLDGPDSVAIIANQAGRRLGFALLAARRTIGFGRRPSAELLAIALDAPARGVGIGRLLLERAELVARGWDADEMRLHTAASNHRAQRFFTAAGYVPSESAPSTYPSGEDALALKRSLR